MDKRKRLNLVLCAALLAIAGVSAVGSAPQDSIGSFLIAGDQAFGLVSPVQVVCGAAVQRAEWSPDGSYVYVERLETKASKDDIRRAMMGEPLQSPPPTLRVYLWSKKSEKLAEILTLDPRKVRVERHDWIPGSNVALLSLSEDWENPSDESRVYRQSLVELNAQTSSYRALWTSDDPSEELDYTVSTKLPFALLLGDKDALGPKAGEFRAAQVYRPGSGLGAVIPLPDWSSPTGWTSDGSKLTLLKTERTADGKRVRTELIFDPFTGKATPMPEEQSALRQVPGFQPAEGVIARLREDRARYQRVGDLKLYPEFVQDEPSSMRPLYVEPAKNPPAQQPGKKVTQGLLITAEAEFGQISPASDAVLYVTRGVAIVRPLIVMNLEEFKKVEKESAMRRAKQVALGMLMYAADYDDVAVPNDGIWQELIQPYCKNQSIFEGFQYTFGGGLITDVKDPASTELGYIAVTGGRVVAYLDGHVIFVPSPAALLGEVRRPREDPEDVRLN